MGSEGNILYYNYYLHKLNGTEMMGTTDTSLNFHVSLYRIIKQN